MFTSRKNAVFTATPDPIMANVLQRNYRKKLKTSFLKLLNIAELGYQQITPRYDLCVIKRIIATLDVNKKIQPALYYIHYELVHALKNHNIHKVHRLIEYIKPSKNFYSKNIFIENIFTDWWETDMLTEIHLPREAQMWPKHKIKFHQLDINHFQKNFDIVNNVLWLLKEADPSFFKEIYATVTKIKLHQGEAIVGMTSPKCHGAMFISTPTPSEDPEVFFCEHIAHEASHMFLNAVLTQDKLILNPLAQKYEAPIQNDFKSMLNVFHTTFVLSRSLRVLQKIKPFFGRNDYLSKALTKASIGFAKGYACIQAHAELTPAGKSIVDSLEGASFGT
jgi:hypothetical protein